MINKLLETNLFKSKKSKNRELISIENKFCEKLGISNVIIQNGIKNFLYAMEFNKLFQIWPPFIRNDPKLSILGALTFSLYPQYQYFIIAENKLIGYASTVPVLTRPEIKDLPDEGYTWAIQSSLRNFFYTKNTVSALAAVVDPELQGQGLSKLMIELLKTIAIIHGFSRLIVPVRPTLKSKFPKESIDKYIERVRDDKLPFDPWLRAHAKSGGKILNICHKSMVIKASLNKWNNWTQKTLTTGKHQIDGALVPITIDIESREGSYIEPNVWVSYTTT